jgi:hypothetical protein
MRNCTRSLTKSYLFVYMNTKSIDKNLAKVENGKTFGHSNFTTYYYTDSKLVLVTAASYPKESASSILVSTGKYYLRMPLFF